ncbi:MAG: c-type cytochrome [Rhodocyclaceae bacterium]|nr:c-type cytochrome [Rhodocyclaceae bacterium]
MRAVWAVARRAVVWTALCVSGALPVAAQTDAAVTREEMLKAGGSIATFCANCHGDSGISKIPDVPNLAAQNPDYLLVQIEAFASGKRKNAFMEGLMRVLEPADKLALAAFYAAQPAPPVITVPEARRVAGGAAFTRLCARCHGDNAHGNETTPRLAGQQAEYLSLNLKRYLDLTGERFYAPMTAAVTQLGEKNIPAVVDYLRTLP